MSRKKLPILASLLLLLAILLLGKSFIFRSGSQTAGPSGPVPEVAKRASGGSGRLSTGPDAISKLAAARPPEPFEASKEVAALLGNGTETQAEVVAKLIKFAEDPGRPLSARQEAMTHLLNLCSGTDSESTLLELASRPQLGKELRSQIVADSLNHSIEFRGELLVYLLENPQLGEGSVAREGLRALVGEDLGDSPSSWREALKQLAAKPR